MQMARASIRELLRFRNPFLSHQLTIMPSKPNNFSSFTSDIPTFSHYHRTMNLLDTCQNLIRLFQIQAQLVTCGHFQNLSLAGRLLKLSLDFCDIDYTLLIFRCIDFPDTFCINTVIKAYACSSVPNQAVGFYFEMLKNGFIPNSYTFPPLVSSCAKTGCSALGHKCHGQAVKNGVDGVLPVQNSLIHMYACCGLIDIADRVFVNMSVRDLVSWNSIVDGYVKVGDLAVAHKLFDAMPMRNVISWNIMISGYLDGKNPGVGLKLFRKMAGMRFRGTDTTIVSVLTVCSRSARLKEGRSVHATLIRTFVNTSLIIGTALIDMYSRCGKPDTAQIIFDRMLIRNLVCWNAMTLGHCIHGNPQDGLLLYEKMVNQTRSEVGDINIGKGIKTEVVLPDEITFVGVLCACVREGLLTEGKTHFNEMTDVFNVKPNFAHHWCMANLFASYGLVNEAMEILRNMPVDTNDSSQSSLWAGLLGSCRFKGDVVLGERIAKALIDKDPLNDSYYSLLLNIYAVAGQWKDVARMQNMMKERGFRKIPGCSLADLTDIVHNLKEGDKWEPSLIGSVSMDDPDTWQP